jgi:hypothetical protein
MSQYTVQILICYRLKVARKHLGDTSSGILEVYSVSASNTYPQKQRAYEDGEPLTSLALYIP